MLPAEEVLSKLKVRFERKTLHNSLGIIVLEDHRTPVVSVSVWYKVGSRYEYPGISGISHLLEHMMFKGTDKYGPEEFSKIIQSLGGYDNAFTWKDETAYYSVVPSSKVEIPLEMEADRMRNLSFYQFDEELNVVKEERKLRVDNNPDGRLFEEIFLTAFSAHPYRIPVIGFESDLESMSLDKVKSYYETHYSPANAILIIVGDIETERAFNLAESYFGEIESRGVPEQTVTREPEQEGLKIRELHDKKALMDVSTLSFHVPQFSHEDTPALSILTDILGGGRSSRLYAELVYQKRIATNVDIVLLSLKDPGLLIIYSYWNQGTSVESGEEMVKSLIEKLKDGDIRESELEKSRKKVLANFVFKQESISGLAMLLGEYTILSNPEWINRYPEELLKVSKDDVMKVAQKYLREDNMTIVRLRKT